MKPVTEQQKFWISMTVSGFFLILKTLTIALFLLMGVLVISQSSVAPVSTRLLSMYAVEYAMYKVKPYRHFFPKPYMVNLEAKEVNHVRH